MVRVPLLARGKLICGTQRFSSLKIFDQELHTRNEGMNNIKDNEFNG